MDPLSDLLRVVRLDGAYFYEVEAAGAWNVEALPARALSPRILPTAEYLISYHVVTEGRCYGGLVGEVPVELAAGDVILFPHGDAHVMSSDESPRTSGEIDAVAPAPYPETVRLGDAGPRSVALVCGFLGCDRRPFNPLLAALPRLLRMRGMSSAWIGGITRTLTDESRNVRAGAHEVVTRLAELMFIEALRRYLDELPPGQTGWLAGLRDPVVGRALTQLHSRPRHPWTLAELAREAGASRSSLAKRFSQIVGQPPMQYLTQWRMQIAASLLIQGSAKIATVGAEVGYDSEAAFSRAYKQATGLAPGAWREARRQTRP